MVSQSMDEDIVTHNIYRWIRHPKLKPSAIIYVLDANNIRRNLYFSSQILELGIPIIVLVNMFDILSDDNKLDYIKLKEEFGVHSVIPFSAVKKKGMKTLNNSLSDIFNNSLENE